MQLDELKRILRNAGYEPLPEERLPNDHGWQLRVVCPEIISIFDTGNVLVQGKRQIGIGELLRKSEE